MCITEDENTIKKIILVGQISVHTVESDCIYLCTGHFQNLSKFHRQYFENNICRVLIFYLKYIFIKQIADKIIIINN